MITKYRFENVRFYTSRGNAALNRSIGSARLRREILKIFGIGNATTAFIDDVILKGGVFL